MKAAQWIDRAKAENGWPSDYRAAKELGITRGAVSTYRQKPDATLDESVAFRLAQALHLEPAAVLLDQYAERSKDAQVKAAIQAASARLYIMLSSVAIGFVARPQRRHALRAA